MKVHKPNLTFAIWHEFKNDFLYLYSLRVEFKGCLLLICVRSRFSKISDFWYKLPANPNTLKIIMAASTTIVPKNKLIKNGSVLERSWLIIATAARTWTEPQVKSEVKQRVCIASLYNSTSNWKKRKLVSELVWSNFKLFRYDWESFLKCFEKFSITLPKKTIIF